MRSVFGVAGEVAPGELAFLSDRFAADGMVAEVVSLPGLELLLVGRSDSELVESHQERSGVHAIAVGRPLHPVCRGIASTLLDALGEYRSRGSRSTGSWLGEFNLLLADGPGRVLELETDCLGLRPLFIQEAGARVVFGSEAWPLVEAGLVPPTMDLDAFASWILLEHPLNGRSLFHGLHRMPPGRARIDLVSGQVKRETNPWSGGDAVVPKQILADSVVHAVDEYLTRVIRDEDRIGLFLSGGYDSRYIACRLRSLGKEPEEAVLVEAGAGDLETGRQVAARLGIPLSVVQVPGSIYDVFEEPWFFAPHGFPQRRFYTSLAVRGMENVLPMVDGLLGDDGVRGWKYEQVVKRRAKDPSSLSDGLLNAHLCLRPEVLFTEGRAQHLRRQVLNEIDRFRPDVESETRRAWLWVLLHRTRDFHAKNHGQVLDRTETYHPFVTPELIRLRLDHRSEMFDGDLYEMILAQNCKVLDGIPHSDSLPRPDLAHLRFSRVFRARTGSMMAMVAMDGSRMGLERVRVAQRLCAYAMGHRGQLHLVRPLDRIRVLGGRVKRFGAELPWEDLWTRPI